MEHGGVTNPGLGPGVGTEEYRRKSKGLTRCTGACHRGGGMFRRVRLCPVLVVRVRAGELEGGFSWLEDRLRAGSA